MRFSVLGPLEVSSGLGAANIGGGRGRALMVRLLVDANKTVPVARLVEDLWDGEPPDSAIGTLRVQVSRLRRLLPEPHRLAAVGQGYCLRVQPGELDSWRFAELVQRARRQWADGELEGAAECFETAAALWRGDALADVSTAHWARAEIDMLEEQRWGAIEDAVVVALERGEHNRVLGELDAFTSRQPQRERLWAARMLALFRAGRAAEALGAYQELRRYLAENHGLDPSSELRLLERRILEDDPSLLLAQDAAHSIPLRPTALPRPLTSLVGRGGLLAELVGVVRSGQRVLSLTGPGGVGKTRLALETAHQVSDAFARGAVFVDLVPVESSEELLARLGQVLGVGGEAQASTGALADALAGTSTLIVLDNGEHLLEVVRDVVHRLVTQAPGVSVMVTSRQTPGIDGELVWRVPPLEVPGAEVKDPSAIAAHSGCRLFLERARHAGLQVDALSDTTTVAEICRRVDGLPLGIELSAGRTPVMSVREIAEALESSPELLANRSKSAPERHRSLDAVLGLSVVGLSAAELALLSQLAVFRSGAAMDALEQLAPESMQSAADVLETVHSLVDKSLVVADVATSRSRYRLLETVRAYCLRQLSDAELAGVKSRHAACALALVERARSMLEAKRHEEGMQLLRDETDEWSAALRYFVETGDSRRAYRMASTTGEWWWGQTQPTVGRRAIEAVLDLDPEGADYMDRATVLRHAGALAREQGDYEAVMRYVKAGLELAKRTGDKVKEMQLSITLAGGLMSAGDLKGAEGVTRSALGSARNFNDQRGVAAAAYNLALIVWARGELDEARRLAVEAGDAYGEAGIKRGVIVVENLKAGLALERGETALSWQHALTTLEMVADTDLLEPAIEALEIAAALCARIGDHRLAAVLLRSCRRQRLDQSLELAVWDAPKLDGLHEELICVLGEGAETAFAEGDQVDLATALQVAVARGRRWLRDGTEGPECCEGH